MTWWAVLVLALAVAGLVLGARSARRGEYGWAALLVVLAVLCLLATGAVWAIGQAA